MTPPLDDTRARPLDPAWLEVVDAVAPRVLGRDDRKGDALVAEIRRASELYTRERDRMEAVGHAARLRFFLLRDLPKIEGPLAELAARDALPSGPTWRVLDVGAGLGTSSLGLAGYAKRVGVERLEVRAMEREASALDVFASLAREAAKRGTIAPITLTPERVDLEAIRGSRGEVDLVLVGLSLNELFRELEEPARLDAIERLVRGLGERLAPGGSLIILEPALRDVTRALMALRDRLAAGGALGVFAPCVRAGPCPMLRRERDWCHAELPFALPGALAERAKQAGLRWERLTYAYLTLRTDDVRLGGGDPKHLRVVGGPVESKGKREWDLCGEPGLVRLRRLDRERSEASAALDDARRGTRLVVDAELRDGEGLRVGSDVVVRKAP